MIDYGRESDIPSKVPKVIDYGHGDCIGAVNNECASFIAHASTSVLSTSSESLQKYKLYLFLICLGG